jgi:hypothetical protein
VTADHVTITDARINGRCYGDYTNGSNLSGAYQMGNKIDMMPVSGPPAEMHAIGFDMKRMMAYVQAHPETANCATGQAIVEWTITVDGTDWTWKAP